jgi:hypothetical protein
MSVPLRIGLAILAAATLTSCDPMTSISRTATVGRLPSRRAVSAALHEVPGMRSVQLRETKPSTGFSLYEGVVRDPAFDQFLYQGASASGVVEIRETEKGAKTVRLYCGWMGPRPPKAAFDDTRTLMDLVYAHLRERIPYLPPPSEVKEELMRPPLR